MESIMEEFADLKINLKEIKEATNNFGSKVIGKGGFGKVYEGEVSHHKGRSIVAIKRLSREFGQGDPEFLKELMMLSRYSHKNLISLLRFCDENGEKILVYEHASNGSLDRHLSSTFLTWTQRIKICLDVATGLAYLHDHKGTQQRVLHRDIKSANILLDDKWNAKLSDMGLSKIGPANQQHTLLFTNVVGTPGYCDPQYMESYSLTKESDIYSFGVVLFEVLLGKLCYKYTNGGSQFFVPMWKQSYIDKKLDEIIFKDLTPPLDPISLETISNVAFQCLHPSRDQRPTTSLLVEKLEIAVKLQERHDVKLTNVVGTSQNSIEDRRTPLSKHKTKKGRPIQYKDAKGRDAKTVHFAGAMNINVDDIFSGSAELMLSSVGGIYYKVILKNGVQVAVNILSGKLYENEIEINDRLNLLAKIRHPNLLTVRAYSKEKKLLVYDYMPKGSLSAFLHALDFVTLNVDRGPEERIDWPTRMRIAKGVARGLLSLHTHHNIIHGTLTSSNIFLNENNNPKISDFGMSQIMTVGSNSTMIVAARRIGYHAPGVSKLKHVDMKDDVYSWGVIMLELLTGKSPRKSIQGQVLPQWVGTLVDKSAWTNEHFDYELIKDASSVGSYKLLSCLELALQCVRLSRERRPNIQAVLQQLEDIKSKPNI